MGQINIPLSTCASQIFIMFIFFQMFNDQKCASYISYDNKWLGSWVLSSQLVNRATVGFLMLVILFYFIAEGASGFLSYISVTML